MKTTNLILLLNLLVALPVAADQPTLRYKLTGELQLTMEQDIYPGGRTEPLAGRKFAMTFAFLDEPDEGEPQARLTSVEGTYSAHGMNQRLSASHLAGDQVFLESDGRSIRLKEPGGDINLGTITDGGLHPSELLVGVLPALPEGPVSSGMTWENDRIIRSLEGWAWAGGEIHYQNEIKAISNDNGHTVVQVQSHGKTTIRAAAGNEGFVGEGSLERTIDWSFDADSGQLLSLSLEQEGTGANQLPQGEITVRQVTRIELQRNSAMYGSVAMQ
jgi:hypothetical protein